MCVLLCICHVTCKVAVSLTVGDGLPMIMSSKFVGQVQIRQDMCIYIYVYIYISEQLCVCCIIKPTPYKKSQICIIRFHMYLITTPCPTSCPIQYNKKSQEKAANFENAALAKNYWDYAHWSADSSEAFHAEAVNEELNELLDLVGHLFLRGCLKNQPWGIFTSSQIGDFWTICLMQLPRIA